MSEKEVFIQEVSDEEMEAVAGGEGLKDHCGESHTNNCSNSLWRNIYAGGFPNCAATVEADSWCGSNDACVEVSVVYTNMNECHYAWD